MTPNTTRATPATRSAATETGHVTAATGHAGAEAAGPTPTRALAVALAVVVVAVPALTATPVTAGPAAGGASATTAQTATGPEVACALTRTEIAPGETVTVEVDPSAEVGDLQYDKRGDGNFGDFTQETSRTFTYEEPGTYAPQVRAWAYPSENSTVEPCGNLTVVGAAFETEFTYRPEPPAPGEPVVFAADVAGDYEGALEFAWDWTSDGEFDATTGDPDGIQHAFDEAGEHRVTLRVTDDAGRTATAGRVVVVEAEATPTERTDRPEATPTSEATPTPEPTPTPTVAEGELTAAWWYTPLDPQVGERVTLAVENAAAGATYRWDLDGDGSADATGPAVSHTFAGTGDHRVTLRVTAPGTDDRAATKTIAVAERARTGGDDEGLSFWYTPLDPQPGEMVVLVASPADPDAVEEFGWDLDGDGSVDQRGPVASHTFPENGSASVVLEVQRPDGTTETVTNDVAVEAPPGASTGTDTAGDEQPPDGGSSIPGPGVPLAVLAVALAAAVVARRERRTER